MAGQFIVPQFIDKEDRIIGPITVRQFLIMLGGAGVLFAEYKVLETAYFILALIPTVGIAGTFGFLRVNGQPFHLFFLNFLQTQMRPKLRVWNKAGQKEYRAVERMMGITAVEQAVAKPRPSSSRLRDLALTVNTGGVYRSEDETLLKTPTLK